MHIVPDTLDLPTPLAIFEHVVTHLFKQNIKAKNGLASGCMYRGVIPAGTCCAVGCLIGDRHYDPALETSGRILHYRESGYSPNLAIVTAVQLTLRRELTLGEIAILDELQTVHDLVSVDDWPERLAFLRNTLDFDSAAVR